MSTAEQTSALPGCEPCCMDWMYRAKCTCGAQASKPGRRTLDGVTSFSFDMPSWSRETTRLIDGATNDHCDPAEALLNASIARLEIALAQQDEAQKEAEHQERSTEIPLEARMGLMVIRSLVEPYELVPNFAPDGAEERMQRLLRGHITNFSSQVLSVGA